MDWFNESMETFTISNNPYSALNYKQRTKDIEKSENNISSLREIYKKYDYGIPEDEYIDGLNSFSRFIDGLKNLKNNHTGRAYKQKSKENLISIILNILNNNKLNKYIKSSTYNSTTLIEYPLHKLCRLSINYKYKNINISSGQEIKAFKTILSKFRT